MSTPIRAWLVVTNAALSLGLLRVFLLVVGVVVLTAGGGDNDDDFGTLCDEKLMPPLRFALALSFLEVFNALIGATRSNPLHVSLFAVVRFGVEHLCVVQHQPSNALSCGAWQHLWTVACWSLGDAVRFFCFFIDNFAPRGGSSGAKSVRYTVGPLLFPLGFLGEMLMVIAAAGAAETGMVKVGLYGAACLWPAGFYPLYTQLLRQRRKFFSAQRASKKEN